MNRKATFAKRQRESDLKDKAKQKEARRAERRDQPRTTKGPEIAWDEAVNTSNLVISDVVPAGAAPGGTATSDSSSSSSSSSSSASQPSDNNNNEPQRSA